MQSSSNSCPSHPSQRKEFVCPLCKKIYCFDCLKIDKPHRASIKGLSEHLLDSFEFEQYLGEGTFGCVFKVISLGDDLPYALKVLSGVETEEDFAIISKEAKQHAKMSHPNIIKYNSSFRVKNENLFVVVLELADTSLAAEIKSLSPKIALSYFTQMMEALRYLHEDL